MKPASAAAVDLPPAPSTLLRPLALVRMTVTGVLMGLANLVPGVSGGTMVLVMGLYRPFIRAVANLTRLCFKTFDLILLGTIALVALVCVATLAEPTRRVVSEHRLAMYALFVGLTLGGAPLLYRLSRPLRPGRLLLVLGGFGVVAAMAWWRPDHGAAAGGALDAGAFAVQPGYARDVLAGVLGIAAMILPGISGAYMLLLIGRYEMVLGAIGLTKTFVLSGGQRGDLSGLHVLIPVALGALVGLVGISNLLKWLLRHYEAATSAVLLGVLLGSTAGLWPFEPGGHHGLSVVLLLIGLSATLALSWLSHRSA